MYATSFHGRIKVGSEGISGSSIASYHGPVMVRRAFTSLVRQACNFIRVQLIFRLPRNSAPNPKGDRSRWNLSLSFWLQKREIVPPSLQLDPRKRKTSSRWRCAVVIVTHGKIDGYHSRLKSGVECFFASPAAGSRKTSNVIDTTLDLLYQRLLHVPSCHRADEQQRATRDPNHAMCVPPMQLQGCLLLSGRTSHSRDATCTLHFLHSITR
jgi:hypothetical protein